MTIAGFMVFFIGFIFIISYPYNKKMNNRCTGQTRGTLVGYLERRNSRGPLPAYRVFSYSVDGIEYTLKTGERSKEATSIGESCTIWYNPKKPQDATVYKGSDDYLKKLLIIGIVLLVLGFVLMIIGLAQ